MKCDLAGKVSLVTGAARGIGQAIADRLAANGSVVAYTDKGTCTGFHDLATNTVNLQNGTRSAAAAAGTSSNFTAELTASELASFNAAWPNRS